MEKVNIVKDVIMHGSHCMVTNVESVELFSNLHTIKDADYIVRLIKLLNMMNL